jgi:predicted PurR-regulated permease PerM
MFTTWTPDGGSPAAPPPEPRTVRLDIPAKTLAKVAFATLLTLGAMRLIMALREVIIMTVVAMLAAVVLTSFVDWLQRKGIRRGIGALISLVAILSVVGLLLALTVPPLIQELHELFTNLPAIAAKLRTRLSGNPEVYDAIVRKAEEMRSNPFGLVGGVLRIGRDVVSNTFAAVLLLTLALYFTIDGAAVRTSVLRLTPARYRTRMSASLDGTARVVRAYFIGQSIVSLFFATFKFLLLTFLHVPYAVVFAVLGFFLSAIPNIGATIALVLPALVALATRGVTTAAILAAAVLGYQQIENAFISPRVLSNRLQVTSVATLIAVLAGGKVMGVIGIVLAIPVAGILPVLARIWFGPSDVVSRDEPPVRPSQEEEGSGLEGGSRAA